MGRQEGRKHTVDWKDSRDLLGWGEDVVLLAGWLMKIWWKEKLVPDELIVAGHRGRRRSVVSLGLLDNKNLQVGWKVKVLRGLGGG